MLNLNGKYGKAVIFTDNVENECISQIMELLNQEFTKDSNIAIMPDCHAGKGCTIGFTQTITDKVIPNLVGVDIGCGMFCMDLGDVDIDLEELDKVINENIPHGFSTHKDTVKGNNLAALRKTLSKLKCYDNLKNIDHIEKSLGTLGGGNHFIELNVDENTNHKYLVIHSGSRNLGKQICEYYQELAISTLNKNNDKKRELISKLKEEGKHQQIESELNKITKIPKELSYLTGFLMDQYLSDVEIATLYADFNRQLIGKIITNKLNITPLSSFTTIHNYISSDNIVRKGAISSQKDELVLIPINMRDGSILAKGKGNTSWNCSAPHGAGRLMSRSKAKDIVSMEEFIESMKDVYSTSVTQSTIDESPFCYKPIEEILECITPTVDVISILKPLYNFKSH